MAMRRNRQKKPVSQVVEFVDVVEGVDGRDKRQEDDWPHDSRKDAEHDLENRRHELVHHERVRLGRKLQTQHACDGPCDHRQHHGLLEDVAALGGQRRTDRDDVASSSVEVAERGRRLHERE